MLKTADVKEWHFAQVFGHLRIVFWRNPSEELCCFVTFIYNYILICLFHCCLEYFGLFSISIVNYFLFRVTIWIYFSFKSVRHNLFKQFSQKLVSLRGEFKFKNLCKNGNFWFESNLKQMSKYTQKSTFILSNWVIVCQNLMQTVLEKN